MVAVPYTMQLLQNDFINDKKCHWKIRNLRKLVYEILPLTLVL